RLDRLEEAGLIRRVPDPHDRRAVKLELTADGERVWTESASAQARKEALVASALTPREQTQLDSLLRKLMLEFERPQRFLRTLHGRSAGAGGALAGAEPVEGLRLATALDAVGHVLGERRPVLEAVARAAAEQPPAVLAGVAVEEEVRVGRQVVLADACAD